MIGAEHVFRVDLRLHALEAVEGGAAEEPLTTLTTFGEVEVVAARVPRGKRRLDDLDVHPHSRTQLGSHRHSDGEHRESGFDRGQRAVARLHAAQCAAEVTYLDGEERRAGSGARGANDGVDGLFREI